MFKDETEVKINSPKPKIVLKILPLTLANDPI